MMMVTSEQVLDFWLDHVGPKGWYAADDALDADIRAKFLPAWEAAREGGLSMWLTYPSGALAYLIVTDQFARNMHRGSADAFALDAVAIAVAKQAVSKGWDLLIDEPARQFFYLPMMHSENLCDQDRCVRLMVDRLPQTGQGNLLHAKAHRDVIRQFGRFPYRNAALGREDTAAETAFVAAGGYASVVRDFQADLAA